MGRACSLSARSTASRVSSRGARRRRTARACVEESNSFDQSLRQEERLGAQTPVFIAQGTSSIYGWHSLMRSVRLSQLCISSSTRVVSRRVNSSCRKMLISSLLTSIQGLVFLVPTCFSERIFRASHSAIFLRRADVDCWLMLITFSSADRCVPNDMTRCPICRKLFSYVPIAGSSNIKRKDLLSRE